VSEFSDALQAFTRYLSAIEWAALAAALGFHILRFIARAFAWQNILRAAYPAATVPFWGTFGAYVGGIGVNSIVPARGGDVLKIVLAKRGIEGSSYATVAASLIPETLFDMLVVGAILLWGLTQGVAPSTDTLANLPTVEWRWVFRHPEWGILLGAALLALGIALLLYAARRVQQFWMRVSQGLAILRRPKRYFGGVVTWQALAWLCRITEIYWFLVAFGLPATLRSALLVIAVQSVATAVPATPGGMGTQQGLLVYVFRSAPITRTALLSFSVGMNIVLTAFNAVLGFAAILVMLRTLRWRHATNAESERAAIEAP